MQFRAREGQSFPHMSFSPYEVSTLRTRIMYYSSLYSQEVPVLISLTKTVKMVDNHNQQKNSSGQALGYNKEAVEMPQNSKPRMAV